MIWIAALFLAAVFMKLGMLLVMVQVLTLGLGLAFALAAGLLLMLVGRAAASVIRRRFSKSEAISP